MKLHENCTRVKSCMWNWTTTVFFSPNHGWLCLQYQNDVEKSNWLSLKQIIWLCTFCWFGIVTLTDTWPVSLLKLMAYTMQENGRYNISYTSCDAQKCGDLELRWYECSKHINDCMIPREKRPGSHCWRVHMELWRKIVRSRLCWVCSVAIHSHNMESMCKQLRIIVA